jgi:hypothetical protein
LAFLTFCSLDIVKDIFSWLLEFILSSLNRSLEWIYVHLTPDIQQVYVDEAEIVLLYLIIFSITRVVVQKQFKSLILIEFLIIVFIIYEELKYKFHDGLIIYNHPTVFVVDVINNGFVQTNVYPADSNSIRKSKYLTQAAHRRFGLKGMMPTEKEKKIDVLVVDGNKIVLLNEPIDFQAPSNPIEVDYLILRKGIKFNISQLHLFFEPDYLITDPLPGKWYDSRTMQDRKKEPEVLKFGNEQAFMLQFDSSRIKNELVSFMSIKDDL